MIECNEIAFLLAKNTKEKTMQATCNCQPSRPVKTSTQVRTTGHDRFIGNVNRENFFDNRKPKRNLPSNANVPVDLKKCERLPLGKVDKTKHNQLLLNMR